MVIDTNYIESAYIRYNANSNDRDMGDCVRRSLSIGLKKPYDDVKRELSKLYGENYNRTAQINHYLKMYGISKDTSYKNELTVEEFCEAYPQGTYLCLCGPANKSYTNHMVCIVDGDYIDSWNSGNRVIRSIYVVDVNERVKEELDIDEIHNTVIKFIEDYCVKLSSKTDQFEIRIVREYNDDDYTFSFTVGVYADTDIVDDHFIDVYMGVSYNFKTYHIKINPAISQEANIEVLKKKLKQQVYDFMWYYKDAWKTHTKLQQMDRGRYWNKQEQSILAKLPDWAIPIIRDIEYNPSADYDKYVVSMDALPDDPYIKQRGEIVYFYADTMKELKDALGYYKKDYSRFNYEY